MEQQISSEFPFESRYLQVQESRMHYIEEGAGDPILFLHGNPTWSYLWRNIIPHVSSQARCIAVDLIGMGKSDKPDIEYRFFDHVEYVEGFIEKMGLTNITLVVHDWGSGLGFHYAMRHPENIKGLAFMEAFLGTLTWDRFPGPKKEVFQSFRTEEVGWDIIVNQNIFIEKILPGSVARGLTQLELDHYRKPFLETASRKPVWVWPNELPIEGEPEDVCRAVETFSEALQQSDIPKLLFHGDPGVLISAPIVQWSREHLKNLEVVNIGPGIHYLQEDNPHLIGKELARWYGSL
ncbi:MAG: haloalkane dehalogenase [Acidobacteriota bacterium]